MDREACAAVSIRTAGADDLADIVRVFLSSRRAFIPYAPLAHGDDDITQWLGGLVARRGDVAVACLDDVVVGFVAVERGIDASWIDQLYVAPGHTGRGMGGLLLAHALALLPRNLPIRLHTFEANAGARRFYEREGFVAVAFGDGADNEEGRPDVLYERAVRR